MKNLLVIGGTGFIGFHIIKEAKKRRFNISSISLNKPKKKRFVKGVKYIKVDISNYEAFKNKINLNYEYVINASGYAIHPDFGYEGDKLMKSHFLGLLNILKLIKKKKIKKFVQIGSSAEYGKVKGPIKENISCKPETPYALAKLSCTNLLLYHYLTEQFPVVILRLFQVYGPRQDSNRILPFLIQNCKKNKSFFTTSGNQFCDFCFIDDAVKAIFKSLLNSKINGEIFNIGSGKKIQIKDLIISVKKIIGKGRPVIGQLKYKKGTNMKNFPNINKAKNKLGWKPKMKLIQGLKKTISTY